MKKGIGHIYLAWRKGAGDRRILVGKIRRNSSGTVSFAYIPEGLKEAKEKGFVAYPDFPQEDEVYTKDVLDIFAQRLNKSEREDIKKYYDYWEIDPEMKDDKYYILAHTQGILPTDNFEFLADYNPVKEMSFVSELCGLSHLQLDSSALVEGDILRWEIEPGNEYDHHAVKLFKGDLFVGYVKKVHSLFFFKRNRTPIKVEVKSVLKNGHINRAFIKISI